MYFNIEVVRNVSHEDFTMTLNYLARETVYFAVNIDKSNHVVVETMILIYTLQSLCFSICEEDSSKNSLNVLSLPCTRHTLKMFRQNTHGKVAKSVFIYCTILLD